MSTQEEKYDAISFAVETAKRRMQSLKDRKEFIGRLTRAEIYEYDMCIECINRGEALLKEMPTPAGEGK